MTSYASYPSLTGKSVFITGGATGIGASMVTHFAGQGASVGFIDIDDAAAEALAGRLGPGVRYLRCDVRDIAALQAAIAAFEAERGHIDVLVNNAANDDRHKVDEVDTAYWDNRMAINLRPQFFAAQAVRKGMARAGGGSIINLGSVVVQMAAAELAAYVTAKAGVYGMTRALAREFGPDRIRVNCLVPGWVMTERQIELWLDEAGERRIAERQCIPDKLMPEDLARMALFLAADDSRHCTSQSFIVDGGWI
ncbi:3-oxoacyl-ACP reductase [Kaistia algarum]|uniref:SDR family NAD(P)-dependent oxidoreductase n=1 Tax=Kaistia algarum TaxID=2083279 RepID=UPI000CE814E0|nr:SDR family oxidoreductase [Kaistia algarum]MCX5516444.1 SDR family NAD(P)-dependent oxidoreductase [Kaistia algarum]PPE78438.1 3-oxoacyl-ACP reductase [Kaistia algarum]